jgi:hypothetical protein
MSSSFDKCGMTYALRRLLQDVGRTHHVFKISALAAAAYVAVAAFPKVYPLHVLDIDQSWIWAINQLPYTPYEFGRDVIFPYGPLAYLLYPFDIGSNGIQSLAFLFVTHAATVALLVYLFLRSESFLAVIMFCISYLLSIASGLNEENRCSSC